MPTDVIPKLGEQGPERSARALVLAVVLIQGGQAEVEDVMIGVTLTLNDEGWRRVAAALAATGVELADGSGRSVTHVLAQAVDQVPTGSR